MGIPIDLSAGIVRPTGGGTGQPRVGQGGIDLSAGVASVGQETGLGATPTPKDPYWLGPVLEDVGIGAAKGLGQTVNTVSKGLRLLPGGKEVIPEEGIRAAENLETPHGFAQGLGVGIENLLEFVAGDEALKGLSIADKLGLAERLWGKVGETALRQAAVGGTQAALHGGGPGETALGAGAGAVGGGLSELAAAKLAPKLMESGLGINWTQRARGAKPGETALAATRGITPKAVAESAGTEIKVLTSRLEAMTEGSTQLVSLKPALEVLGDAREQALAENNRTLARQINQLRNQLTTDMKTNAALGETVPARRALDLKRGVQAQVGTWTPTKGDPITGVAKKVYGAIDAEIDVAAPGTEEINDLIHSLIPVRDRAMIEDLKASIIQQAVKKLKVPTGALTGAVAGGYVGGREGGVPGAIGGGLLGLAGTSILGSPTTLVALARLTGKSQTAVGIAVREVVSAYQMSNRDEQEAGEK